MAACPNTELDTGRRRSWTDGELEEDLRRQCADLEQKLGQDELCFQNEALEVQLAQMEDDFESLKKDFTSMSGFLERQLTEKTGQLEDQRQSAISAEGHADCLKDLLHFHEENGQLINSYWRAQCEKRDGSIRFLTLKLQEYTVPSAEYWAKRQADADSSRSNVPAVSSSQAPSPSAPTDLPQRSSSPSGGSRAPLASIGQSYQTLLDQHHELLREHQELEDDCLAISRELEASDLDRVSLEARVSQGLKTRSRATSSVSGEEAARPLEDSRHAAALEASLEAECSRLRFEVEACELALSAAYDRAAAAGHHGRVPAWAQRCVWRDELDVRAGQLERISLQFDATKRSLDAANEELQWQATSAEALRMRLADVLRAIQAEEAKTNALREEHQQSQREVEELLRNWPRPPRDAAAAPVGEAHGAPDYRAMPLVCQQAHWLIENIRRGSAAHTSRPDMGAAIASATSVEAAAAAAAARLPEEAKTGTARFSIL